MFDEDLFNSLYGGTSTITTDTETSQVSSSDTGYSPSATYNPFATNYEDDDYSVTPNYTSEQNYNTTSYSSVETTPEQTRVAIRSMETPVIKKDETEVVSLVKTQSKIRLEPRMKIVASMFAIILCALVFAIIWNFVSISKLNSMIADKQITISQLQSGIIAGQVQYTEISDEVLESVQKEGSGYVPSEVDKNTFFRDLEEMQVETVIKDIPSNWFNDVCNFFSNLFAA